MRVRARVNLIGVESPSEYRGRLVRVEPATYMVALTGGGSLARAGTTIAVDAMTSWIRSDRACALAELVISAAIDLRTMVLTRADYSITLGRKECPPPTLTWPWRGYELLNWAASKDDLPYTVRLSGYGVRRIGEVIECALAATASTVWAIADGMAAAERAAIGVSAAERIVDLWTGLEALLPSPRSSAIEDVTFWLDGIEAITPGFRHAFITIGSSDLSAVIKARGRIAGLPGITGGLAARVRGPCRTQQERLRVSVACLYAIRNAVIHGSVSARTTSDIDAIRGAEALAWILLDARLSQLICGAIPIPEASGATVAITR